MKLLVTGCTGQLGEAVCSLAASENIECKGFSLKALDITRAFKVYRILRKEKPDYIINAAAFNDIDLAESEPEQCYAVNREGVFHLAKSSARLGIPLIHLSTSSVFSGTKGGPYVEGDGANPVNVFGRSKLQGEHALKSVCDEHIILRAGPVFSEWGDNFLKTLLAGWSTKQNYKLPVDQRFAPTSASDVARVIIAMIRQIDCGVRPWGTYHYTGMETTNWHDFAQSVFEEVKKYEGDCTPELTPVDTKQAGYRADRPLNTVLNCNKILETFGIRQRSWMPEVSRVVKLYCQQSVTN
jgi:dTDP-4-dehydrorhamnose reductase